MTHATSHQPWIDRTTEDSYRFPRRSRSSGPLRGMLQHWRSKKGSRDNFLSGFFELENLWGERHPQSRDGEIYRAFIKSVSSLTESRDPYTAGHQKKVSELAEDIAREMGLPDDMVEGIRVAGIVHDIGKMSVPAEIVTKPAALTSLEFSIIKRHPGNAYEILKEIDFPWPVAEMVLQHHERLDGSGYPRGLKGNEIRLEARVLAVADVIGAMSSHRPYRRDLGIEAALREIHKNEGVFYDTEVARACQRCLKGASVLSPSL